MLWVYLSIAFGIGVIFGIGIIGLLAAGETRADTEWRKKYEQRSDSR